MECHLKTQVKMWIVIQMRFTIPTDNDGLPQSCKKWDASTRKKIKVNTKATQTLQCGLTKEEQNWVGPFISAKELWTKLIELHEGMSDTKVQVQDKMAKKIIEDSDSSESEANDEVTSELANLVRKMI
ncbi:uncharacterized protein LOC141822908 [Curcuma longa]|uniref:uncharacterized protein LOC141822908 n=1 Tax=Curcuma longa TaxID=136217 RepID=UPI003D9F4554